MELFVKYTDSENACKILKNGNVYTENQENSMEACTGGDTG